MDGGCQEGTIVGWAKRSVPTMPAGIRKMVGTARSAPLPTLREPVARMERSVIRGLQAVAGVLPDFASLHPGYAAVRAAYRPCPANSCLLSWPPTNTRMPAIRGRTASTSKPVEVWPVASLTQPIR